MSTPLTEAEREAQAIADLLAEHAYVPSGLRGVSKCGCGKPFYGMPHDHRVHVATLIAAREAAVRADIRARVTSDETRQRLTEALAKEGMWEPQFADTALAVVADLLGSEAES